ncbi:MAG: hypothetical protein JNK89_03495 [Saprospiraceae bacterium]|nr:hypothetical protein [Saprospiraceae bacterium]
MNWTQEFKARLLAVAGVLLFFTTIWLYTREFPVFTNTIGARQLVLSALVFGALAGSAVCFALRQRFSPWRLHIPEIATIFTLFMLLAPLLASRLNRAGGAVAYRSFEFVSEMPYLASNYGLLKGETLRPTGYRLQVKSGGKTLLFQYKKQEYFPLTKPGEPVLLPLRDGWLGFVVLELN